MALSLQWRRRLLRRLVLYSRLMGRDLRDAIVPLLHAGSVSVRIMVRFMCMAADTVSVIVTVAVTVMVRVMSIIL